MDEETGRELLEFPAKDRRVEKCSADLLAQGNFIQTCSLMFRRNLVPDLSDGFRRLKLGDWPLCVLVGQHGQIGYIDRNMATYRLHKSSIWSSRSMEYRIAAGLEMADYLISKLSGNSRQLWVDFLLRGHWSTFYDGLSSRRICTLYGAIKNLFTATFKYRKLELPMLAMRVTRILGSFCIRQALGRLFG